MMIRIGARSSQLSVAQVNLVKTIFKEKLGLESTFLPITSLGDIDTISPIHKVAKDGVFTSTLEQALIEGQIDVAVHSMKDLPTQNPESLKIASVLPRNDPRDVLLIKSDFIEYNNPDQWVIMSNARIGTGSMRRSSQLLSLFPDISTPDIRGNIDTRIKKLEDGFYDGILMAAAVFERLDIPISSNIYKISLDLERFPTAPAQGTICTQMNAKHELFEEVAKTNDRETFIATNIEREILRKLGGGCQLPLGITIRLKCGLWVLDMSLAPENWLYTLHPQLTRIHLETQNSEKLVELVSKLLTQIKINYNSNDLLKNKSIIIAGSEETALKYSQMLESAGAIVQIINLQSFKDIWNFSTLKEFSEEWKNAQWIAITSKKAIQALKAFSYNYPRSNIRIASVGTTTTRELQRAGFPVHLQASKGTAESLAYDLIKIRDISNNGCVLFLSATNARTTFRDILEASGIKIIQIPVYEPVITDIKPTFIFPKEINYIIVLSPAYAKLMCEIYGKSIAKTWVGLGPTTIQSLNDLGIENIIQAKNPTPSGILEVLK